MDTWININIYCPLLNLYNYFQVVYLDILVNNTIIYNNNHLIGTFEINLLNFFKAIYTIIYLFH